MEEIYALRMVRAVSRCGDRDRGRPPADVNRLLSHRASKGRPVLGLLREQGNARPRRYRFKNVLVAEREALVAERDFSAQQVDALLHALDELVQHRNRFAHDPMSKHFQVDVEAGSVVRNEWRIGQMREDGPYFTIESANNAERRLREGPRLRRSRHTSPSAARESRQTSAAHWLRQTSDLPRRRH
jgi:hypothetical protein